MATIQIPSYHSREIIFKDFQISQLTHSFIFSKSATMPDSNARNFFTLQPGIIHINVASFTNPGSSISFPSVSVLFEKDALTLDCECNAATNKLCDHQAQALYNIMERDDLRIFFDASFRYQKVRSIAENYGLEQEPNLDAFFNLKWANGAVNIKPKVAAILPLNAAGMLQITTELLAKYEPPQFTKQHSHVLVFSQHKYFHHLQINIYDTAISVTGKIKNPLNLLDPLQLMWKTNDVAEVKFYTGITSVVQQQNINEVTLDLNALKAIVHNPLQLPVFYHDQNISENISTNSLVPIKLSVLHAALKLHVYLKESFYTISGQIEIEEKGYPLDTLPLKYGHFILARDTLWLMADMDVVRVTSFFKKHHNTILIHQSKFEEFRKTILGKLEDKISISYSWMVAATREQLEENGFADNPVPLIYLSDAGQHVMISPVMQYGEVEVSILSKKQLYARDLKGVQFIIERDRAAELNFTSLLLKQHPEFEDQLYQEAFYLTKKQFLEEGWFLEVFEEWRNNNIKILGFNEIENNKLNANKASVSIKVTSGLDWFNTHLEVRYGKQKASLSQLHKSIKNSNRYVTLDDGTLGLLPAEWIKKMTAYFEAGDIVEDSIRIPFINFSSITYLYEKEMLSAPVQEKLQFYSSKLAGFESIENIPPPTALKTELRHYQQQGLNWLNFLDEMAFGGCLADDMGLGKTIQIIAFILSLKNKRSQNTHLVVVPTSIIFNWQHEMEKFAPSIKMLTIHGNNRVKNNHTFQGYDVVLTSYGMLISNIHFMKSFRFNYIFLDESQAIKNPDSQRYKAVCLLQSFNKVVMTGTPIENNTFDLYGQLSFACPGLLGNKQYFKDIYSQPIDKFGNNKRAIELQQKIDPFILRRTKKQVATELPEKTEMIIYCEMGVEQRKVYDAYEKEFRNYLLHKPEEDLLRDSMNVLQGITKLRQICNSPALLKDAPFYGDAAAKIEVLIEQIENKSKQHKILVFSQFVGMLDLIKKELTTKYIPFEYLTGQTNNRKAVVGSFQNNEDIRVFLISLKAGGIGLNLTEADYVYIVDPWWNPAVENQAIDRCYRIGQQKHVMAIRLICPDTIEEKIIKLQASKNELVHDLIKTDTSMLKQLSKQDLLKLLTPDLLSKQANII